MASTHRKRWNVVGRLSDVKRLGHISVFDAVAAIEETQFGPRPSILEGATCIDEAEELSPRDGGSQED